MARRWSVGLRRVSGRGRVGARGAGVEPGFDGRPGDGRRARDDNDLRRRREHQLAGVGDRGGARRRPVVHQPRQQLDRADHHHRDGHQLHRHRHQHPGRDRGRTRRRLVVHQRTDNNSIGRITTTGTVTNYTGTGINDPTGIAAGPDGALWFTNFGNNSIGRITTAGTVTNYTGPGISDPSGITAGPDGALWFTNYGRQLDRADHHRRDGHQLHRHRHRRPGRDHGRARRRAVVHQPTATTRSGGSPPRGTVTNYTGPGISHPGGIAAGPDGALWFTNATATLDRADHHHRDRHQLHRPRHQRPVRDHGRTRRRAVVHQRRQQLDRADHDSASYCRIVPGSTDRYRGQCGTARLQVPVTLSRASGQPVTVQWRTLFVTGNGVTGRSCQRLHPCEGHGDVLPGQTAKTVTIAVKGDTQMEPDECSSCTSPTNQRAPRRVLRPRAGKIPTTIRRSCPVQSVLEGDAGTRRVNVPVTLSRVSPGDGGVGDLSSPGGGIRAIPPSTTSPRRAR